MQILALIHEEGPCSGVFADIAAEHGGEIEEWSVAGETPPSRPIDEYEAVMLFGGTMHVDQERYHPWLREENLLIQRLLDQHVPLLGVCLGGQLIAKAAHADVVKASEPEIGWFDVELTPEAADDPVFGALPGRFAAYQWHHYRFELPAGAVPLASSPIGLQAFRLGELAWGLQFHCEVTRSMLLNWTAAYEAIPGADRTGFEPDRMRADTDLYITRWNEIGREICDRFLRATRQRAATTSRSAATAGRSSSRSSHAPIQG